MPRKRPPSKPTVHDVIPDARTANLGTDRGRAALAQSIDTYGYGRPILADAALTVIAGNQTLATARQRAAKVLIVPLTGHELLVHQRLDLGPDDPKATGLAIADNRVSQLNRAWSPHRIGEDIEAGLDLSRGWSPRELAAFVPPEAVPAPAADRIPDMTHTPAESDGGAPLADEEVEPVTHDWVYVCASPAALARWEQWLDRLAAAQPTRSVAQRLLSVLP